MAVPTTNASAANAKYAANMWMCGYAWSHALVYVGGEFPIILAVLIGTGADGRRYDHTAATATPMGSHSKSMMPNLNSRL